MRSKQALWLLASMISGWIVGWGPTHVANYYYGDMPPLLLLTLLLPLTTFMGHRLLLQVRGKATKGPSIAAFMLLGMWTLEPTYLFFISGDLSWRLYFLFTFFPPYSFIMSVYAGSMLGLLFSSSLLVVEHCVLEIHNWILPFTIGKQFVA